MSGEQYGTFKAITAQGIKGIRRDDKKKLLSLKNLSNLSHIYGSTRDLNQRQIFRVESIKAYNELENYFTKLWTMRGIKWTE